MFVDLLEHIADVERKLGNTSKTFIALSLAFKEYPTLRANLDHTGRVQLCTPDVNKLADTIEITHRIDSNSGSLLISPYVTTEKGVRIYADPPNYVVGSRNPDGFGEIPLADWEELLKDSALSAEVIRKVRWYLGAHAKVDYDQVPDDESSTKETSSTEVSPTP